jgi:hypothetical protein
MEAAALMESLANNHPKTLQRAHNIIHTEMSGMGDVYFAKTSNRSVLGVMKEFVYLAEGYRDHHKLNDPLALSLKLSETPCGPLYKGPVFPSKAVRELADGG